MGPKGEQSPAKAPADLASPSLSDRDMRILAFEHEWWRHAGAKDEAIRAEFGLNSARYYQLLNAVIDSPAAVVHDPMLVRRLQRVRDARTGARTMRRMSTDPHTTPTDRETDGDLS
ncbi:MAG TPA: DUF3263 domain-containing protein [Terrimesophilobacter sp.]|uniref:DUF3263 domain-containing protein n=1 Tax=Terrimesophilobacter sp. TaxID=2906435 RepID=UPI002F95C6B6